jgi:hypothetical protein
VVEIKVAGDKVVFEVEGWDKLWSLRSRLEIPLAHVKGVHADPQPAMGWFDGLKLVGTAIPHIFRAGTFYQEGDLIFWDVRNPEKTIVIELEHERFDKLIIEVDEPDAAVRLLRNALS